jgi:hypothetical protein
MGKLKIYETIIRGEKKLLFWCKACTTCHSLDSEIDWNGNNYTPTIKSSISVRHNNIECHSYIQDGDIIYLDESNHDFKGKRIELDEFYH